MDALQSRLENAKLAAAIDNAAANLAEGSTIVVSIMPGEITVHVETESGESFITDEGSLADRISRAAEFAEASREKQ